MARDDTFWYADDYQTLEARDIETNIAAVATGTIVVSAIPSVIPAGETIDRIAFLSATTAFATLTSQVFALVRAWDRMILAKTADATNAAWPAQTRKALELTAPYLMTEDTAVYIAMRVTATTMGTLAGKAMLNANVAGLGQPPVVTGTAGTAAIGNVGTALPALTAIVNIYAGGCS